MGRRRIDDEALYQWLAECADEGRACPSNSEINVKFSGGYSKSGAAQTALARLVATKRIEFLHKKKNHRRIVICATGKATGESERKAPVQAPATAETIQHVLALARKGYAPRYISGQIKLPIRQIYYILDTCRQQLAGVEPRPTKQREEGAAGETAMPDRHAYLRPLASMSCGFIGPSSTCRWIECSWRSPEFLTRARVGDQTLYCGRRSVTGRSWCPEHLRRVISKRPDGVATDAGLRSQLRDEHERSFYRKCRDGGLSHDAAMRNVLTMREAAEVR